MNKKQFDKLVVTDFVYVPKLGYGQATRINRTTSKIKPFLAKKWYDYKYVRRKPPVGFGNMWGICGEQHKVEVLLTNTDLEKL